MPPSTSASDSQQQWLERLRLDLAEPVSKITSVCGRLLAAGVPDTEQVEGVESIQEAGEGLFGLIDAARSAATEVDLDTTGLRRLRHDLLNELNIVEGYVELMLDDLGPAEAEMAADLSTLEGAAAQARSLVGGIPQQTAGAVAEPVSSIAPSSGDSSSLAVESDRFGGFQTSAVARLLVVDDDESNRDILERRLSNLGYVVELARDGLEALGRLRAADFDLVLLDIVMPVMDGYETIAQIKADVQLRDVPVVMVTAFDDVESIVRCIELGADEYLPKTFNPVLLKSRISALLDRQLARRGERVAREELRLERERLQELFGNSVSQGGAAQFPHDKSLRYTDAIVLVAELCGVNPVTATSDAHQAGQWLAAMSCAVESVAAASGLRTIKTIGGRLLVVGETSVAQCNQAEAVADAAFDMLDAVEEVTREQGVAGGLRIGIHSGTVLAGAIALDDSEFDLWGDPVNVAGQLAGTGSPGQIHICASFRDGLPARFVCARGLPLIGADQEVETLFLKDR